MEKYPNKGCILGHEFMGIVTAVGSGVREFKEGDRVLSPFQVTCKHCYYCNNKQYSLCDNTNPNAEETAKLMGYSPAAFYGYSSMFGNLNGGQAEYVRVPFADTTLMHVPSNIPDEKLLFLTDVFPTGYQAAVDCDIQEGDTIAIWGCGPVGQFAIRSALMLGAKTVIAIDYVAERMAMARAGGARTINCKDDDVYKVLLEWTNGRGPDACIDAVGMEAHGTGILNLMDRAKQFVRLESDRPSALREILRCCRKGGRISIPGVYSGTVDNLPLGFSFQKGISWKMGQCHVWKHLEELLIKVREGEFDPSFIITHTFPLAQAEKAYKLFNNKESGCIKVVLKPGMHEE